MVIFVVFQLAVFFPDFLCWVPLNVTSTSITGTNYETSNTNNPCEFTSNVSITIISIIFANFFILKNKTLKRSV